MRPRVAAPPDGAASRPRRSLRGISIAAFTLSLIALAPPLWLAYEFTANHDDWFEGYGLWFDNAGATALLTVLIFVPVELVLLTPALAFSIVGTRRATDAEPRLRTLAKSALVMSAASLLISAVLVAVAIAKSAGT